MVIMTPSDEQECRQLLYTGYKYQGPAAVRYPRGSGCGADTSGSLIEQPLGKGIVRRESSLTEKRVAILAFGAPLSAAMNVADVVDATVADMRFVKPIDEALILELAQTHDVLVTVEENARMGGAGSAVLEVLAGEGLAVKVEMLGIPDRYIEHDSPFQQHLDAGIDESLALIHISSPRDGPLPRMPSSA